jgi:uncharacterized FAD-dependent dehydrogenase
MCPGGFIVPASTAPGELVVNGMSPSRRDSKFANSGVVVAINEVDWKPFEQHGPLAALELQKWVERSVWEKTVEEVGGQMSDVGCQTEDLGPRTGDKSKEMGDGSGGMENSSNLKHQTSDAQHTTHSQYAPAQRIPDFLAGRVSKKLNETSYQPGLVSMDMNEVLPDFIAQPLRQAIKEFGKRMKGYDGPGGQLIGLESRTSSPVRIPRYRETLQHIQTKRLFPCGEGAGYAGGIVSAAVDGERCAEALAAIYAKKN